MNYEYFAYRISDKLDKLLDKIYKYEWGEIDLTLPEINKIFSEYGKLRRLAKSLGIFRFLMPSREWSLLEYPETFMYRVQEAFKQRGRWKLGDID